MANGTPLTSNEGNGSGAYVYGAFVLKQGRLIDEDGNHIVDENGNKIYTWAVVPNGEE